MASHLDWGFGAATPHPVMRDRAELTAILQDRQRFIDSPEARFMRGCLPDAEVGDLLAKWRGIVRAEALNNHITGDTV